MRNQKIPTPARRLFVLLRNAMTLRLASDFIRGTKAERISHPAIRKHGCKVMNHGCQKLHSTCFI